MRRAVPSLFLLLSVVILPGIAQSTLPETAADPVVRDVVRMLGEGLTSPLIERWLDDTAQRPGPLSADDMILLRRAGASERLIEKLLEIASSASTPADAPDGAAGRGDGGALAISVDYRAVEPVEGEEEQPGRDLFLYLDGDFLARVPSQGDIRNRPAELRALLQAGKHTIRLTRELHTRRPRSSPSWRHETRVCPEFIGFEVGSESSWSLDLRWVESPFASAKKGPLSWELVRNGERVAREQNVGTGKDLWPLLCEDLEANVAEGRDPPRWLRRALEECVRWDGLWDRAADVPRRSEVRAELERHDYRPPAGQMPR